MDSIETRRRQYLQAMGIELWERRAVADAASLAESPSEGVLLYNSSDAHGCASVMGGRTPGATEPAHGVAESAQPIIMNMEWPKLEQAILTCTRCSLHKTRTHAVPGVGNRQAEWLVIGEAPGADEDLQGEPFVGRAGQLLNSMLKAIGLAREKVYIANILKCRPPSNRDPLPEEAATCEPYLNRQIELLKPKIILAVGRIAAQNLLKTDTKIGALRGKRHVYPGSDIPVVVTYHPAYLLRSPQEKRKAWEDLQLACRVFKGEA